MKRLASNLATLTAMLLAFALNVSAQNAFVSLAWDASPDSTVTGYALYYTVAGSPIPIRKDVGPALTTTVSNLTTGATYNFYVVAYNAQAIESDPSNILPYTPQGTVNPPTALSLTTSTPQNTPVAITLQGNDPQSLPLTFSIVSQPASGALSGSGANRTYTPQTGFSGADNFTYKVNNGTYDSAPASVNITVVPDSPSPPTTVSVGLLWDASPDASVTGYALYYGVVGSSTTNRLNVGMVLSTTISNLNVGSTYFIFVVAYNASGTESDPSNVLIYTPGASSQPAVALTAPASGASYTAPATISLAASVTANGHTITKVQFYNGTTLLGEDASAPYSFIWSSVSSGNYNLTASAVYDAGSTLTSSPVSVTVANLSPPLIALTAPASGASYTAPATISLAASVTANGHTITKVQFYNGATLLGEDTSAPYTFTWSSVGSGSYNLTASVVYDAGSTLTSSSVNVTVAAPSGNPSGGLVAAYGFEQGSGASLADSSTNGNTGTINGASWVPGKFGQALNFNGVDNVVVIASSPSLNVSAAMTLEAWVYPTAAQSTWKTILHRETDAYYLHASCPDGAMQPAGGAIYNGGESWVSGPTALPANAWTHLATTYDGTTQRLFVNGSEVASAARQGSIETNSKALRIGGNTYPGQFFQGLIDEVRIYNRSLSVGEIQADMNTPVLGTGTNPPPMANALTVAATEDTATSITLTGISSGGSLSYAVVTQPGKGTLSGTAPNLIYTPAANLNGADSFTFKVNDGLLDSAVATVSINIAAVNDAPVAQAQPVTVTEDIAQAIILSGFDLEGNPLTYTILTQPAKGTLSGTGPNLTFTPAANLNGADSFTFRVNDGSLNSAAATVSITITAVNDPPVANAQSVVTVKNVPLNITLNGSDVEGNSLTYTILTQPANGTLSGSGANRTYTPGVNYTGNDNFTFNVSDGSLSSAAATVSITVQPTNVAPVANNQSVSVIEDTARTITLSGSDADSNPLTYSVLSQPAKGALSGTAPNLTYTPSANANGADSFTFKVNDGTVDSAPATVSITVTAVNDPPTAEAQSVVTTSEDTPKAIVLAGTDTEGSTLNYIILSQPGQGFLSGTAPNLTFTPNLNANGSDSFTFKVNDGVLDSAVATVLILVTPVNDAPIATAQSLTTPKNTSRALTLSGSDVDGDFLTFTIVSAPAHGTLIGTAPNLTYTPANGYVGADLFTFKANDGTVDSVPAIISLNISQNNQAPIANGQNQSTSKNKSKAIILTATDVEGDPLTYTITSAPAHGSLSGSAPNMVYTPALDYSGSDSFTFKVNDGAIDSAIATVALTVNPNVPPIANTQSVTTTEDAARALTLTGSDPDGDGLNYTVIDSPTHGTLSGTAPNLVYTPATNFSGTDSFTFLVDDGALSSSLSTVSLTVAAVNDAPLALAQSQTTPRNVSCALTLGGADVESDPLSFSVLSPPAHGTLSGNPPNLTYTPAANYAGPDSFTFRVTDGAAASAPASVTLNVLSGNTAPVASSQSLSATEDTPQAITLAGSDPEGNPLTYSLLTPPAKGSLSGTAPNLIYTPFANLNGPDTFSFKVNDGSLDSSAATIAISILAVNDPPSAVAQGLATDRNVSRNITLTGSDVEGSALAFTIVSAPAHGSLSGTAPNLTYAPAANYSGTDSFTFKVNDGAADSAPATVIIAVNSSNVAPVANGQSVTTAEDTARAITLSGSDVDGNPLTYLLLSQPTKGSLSGTAPNLTFTPNANANGADSFTFKVNDGLLDSAVVTVALNITAVNDVPVAHTQNLATDKNTPLAVTLTGSDVESASLYYSINTAPTHGRLSGSAPFLTYIPDANYTGPDSFTFRADDGSAFSSPAAVNLNVRASNATPVANNQSLTTAEDTARALTLTGSDPDGDGLNYTVIDSPTHGTLSGTAPNLVYTPATNFSGTDSFTFLVDDGALSSSLSTVSLTVAAVNDAPLALAQSQTTPRNVSCALTLGGADVESDPLSFSVLSPPAHGTLSGNPPNLTYTPAANYAGPDSFTFRVTDGAAASAPASVTLNVLSGNTAPVASSQSLSATEDTPQAITLAGSDPEGNPLTYSLLTPPAKGSLSGTAPNLIYTPFANLNGPDTFSFKVNDGSLDSSAATIAISILAVNDPPSAVAQGLATDRNVSRNITLTGSDVEGSALAFTIVSAPAHGSLSGTAPNLTYAPAANYSGTDSFTFKVNDGAADSAPATVIIAVNSSNVAPVANGQSVTTAEDTARAITLSGSDVDGNPLTYLLLSQPTKGSLSGTAPNLTFTPNANANGADSFTFKVNDGLLDSAVVTVALNITAVNDVPVAHTQNLATDKNTPLAVTLTGSDVESASLYYSINTAPTHGRLSGSAPFLTYIPDANYTGPDSFTFRADDGSAFSSPAAVNLNVRASNATPVANNQSLTTAEDTARALTLTGSDPDGDGLNYTVIDSPTHGTLSGTAPNLVYTPATNFSGTDSFTFLVDDGALSSSLSTVSLTVAAVNDAPLALAQSQTTPRNVSCALTLGGADVESDPLSFSVLSPPAHGTLSGNPPNLTYTPAANYAGPDSFTFRVTDGAAASAPASVTLNVLSGNTAPVASSQSLSATEDTPQAITLAGSDPEGNPLTYSLLTPPAKGSLSGTAPNLIYTPFANLNGPDTFSFKVNDGSLDSSAATIAISILAVNDPPSAVAQGLATDRNVSRNITLTGSDVEGSALAFTIVSAPAHGSLSGTAPNLTYAPAANYSGTDSFTFKVNDGAADSAPATVIIAVNSSNVAPVANGQSVTTAEDTARAITLSGSDVDGNPLTYLLLSQPTKGSLSGTAPNLTFTPNANANGADSFTFKVNDGLLDSAVVTVALNITAVNDVPVAHTQNLATDKNTPLAVTLTGSDVESASLYYSINTAPTHGRLSGSAPFLTYIPDANYTGPDSFTFRADDGSAFSSPAAVNLNVRASNATPVANNQSLTTAEDTARALTLTGSDPDGDGLNYTVIDSPTHGTLSGTAPNLVYTPATNFSGTDSFTFLVDDGALSSSLSTVSLTVAAVNDAPLALAQSQTTPRNVSCALTLGGADVESDPLSFSVLSPPAHGTLSGNPPNLTYTPAANYAGPDSFTFRVTDGAAASAPASVTLNVLSGNTAPVASSQSLSATEDTPQAITLAGSDPEGNPLTYSLLTPPAKGSLSGTAPNLIYTPFANLNGPDTFSFKVNDGSLDSSAATIAISILAVNDPPSASDLARATDRNVPLTVTLTGFDPEGSSLTYSLVSAPAHGTLSGSVPNLTYTPAADFVGEDSFTFRVYDGVDYSAPATVHINMRFSNSAPAASNQSVATTEDVVKPITLTGSDPDGDPLFYSVINYPSHGTLSGTEPNLVYTPATNFSGTDSFTFLVDDGTLASAASTVSITVTPVNDAPVAQPQSLTTLEDSPISLVLSGSDSEASPLNYVITTQPSKGSLAGTAPNLIYTPNANANGSDSFTFRVSDGALQSATATVLITITAVNDAPVAQNQTVSIANSTVTAIQLTGSDAESSLLSYIVLTLPLHGTLGGSAPNLSYTPEAGYNGADSFTFRVSDSTANSLPATVSLNISTTPDLPEVSLTSVVDATEPAQAGELNLVRTGSTNQPLTVNLALGGSAVAGTDYLAASSVTFAAGSSNATLVITPVDNNLFSGIKTVDVNLAPADTYRLGAISSATVNIQDDERPVLHISYDNSQLRGAIQSDAQRPAEPVTLFVSAAGVSGLTFILQGSTNLSDWSVVAAPAIGQAVRYSESGITNTACYYYRLLWVPGAPTVESIAAALANEDVSENIVGYVNVAADPGWNLVANPLKAVDVSGLSTVVPEKTLFVPFNTTAVNAHTNGTWTAGTPLNGPTEAGWLYNPELAPITLTFVGEMPADEDDTTLPAGWSVRSSPVQEVAMNTEFMDYPFALGDAVFQHSTRNGKDVWSPHLVSSNNGWDKQPSVKAGRAVLIYKNAATPTLGKKGPKLPKLPKVKLKKLAKPYLK